MTALPDSLVEAARNRKLVPFVGAGISVGAVMPLAAADRFPDWPGLITRLASRLTAEAKNDVAGQVIAKIKTDVMGAAELAVEKLGRLEFQDEMRAIFDRSRPAKADLSAVQAIWRIRAPFVMTTNYDSVLEWPWDASRVQAIHNDDPGLISGLENLSFAKLRVWYIHGSIRRPDSLILTSSQYAQLYPTAVGPGTAYENAYRHFKQLLTDRSFFFTGFSLTEPVLRKKLEEVLALTARATPVKFLLLKKGATTAGEQEAFFNNHNVQVLEFDEFGAPMVAAIDAVGRAAWPNTSSTPIEVLTPEMRPLVQDLLDRVNGLALSPDDVARAYNACKPNPWTTALTGGDGITMLRDGIVTLGAAVAPSTTPVPPLLAFVKRLIPSATSPWSALMSEWIDDATTRLTVDVVAAAALRTRLDEAIAPPVQMPSQILVRIRSQKNGEWLVHAWRWTGSQVPASLFGPEGKSYKEGDSGSLIHDLFVELEALELDPDQTRVAFVVPSSLAWQPIHAWTLPVSVAKDPPIGATYTVTVRPLERLERPALVRNRLKRAWDDLKKRATEMLLVLDPNAPKGVGGIPAIVLDAAAATKGNLANTLAKLDAQCVVLRDAPSETSLSALTAVVDTTMPAIVWSRPRAGDPAGVKPALRTFLEAGAIADLPRRIRDERIAAYADETGAHPGMDFMLIWDDADYVPPEQDQLSRARVETI